MTFVGFFLGGGDLGASAPKTSMSAELVSMIPGTSKSSSSVSIAEPSSVLLHRRL